MHGSLVVASPWAQTCTYVLSWTKVFFAVGNADSYDPHGQTRTCYPRISQGMAAAPYEFKDFYVHNPLHIVARHNQGGSCGFFSFKPQALVTF